MLQFDYILTVLCLLLQQWQFHFLRLLLQVGLATVQLAKAYGMKVLGTAGTADGEEVVKQAGALKAFNHRQDGYVQNILVL